MTTSELLETTMRVIERKQLLLIVQSLKKTPFLSINWEKHYQKLLKTAKIAEEREKESNAKMSKMQPKGIGVQKDKGMPAVLQSS